MARASQPLAEIAFDADLFEWRGPAPHVFAALPAEAYGEIRFAAMTASYGWGVVPVRARIGAAEFTTSLFPRDGTYLLPVKLAVRRSENLAPGDTVSVRMWVEPR